jgi:hypothetical protein
VARHLFDTCSTRPTERGIEHTENQISLLKAPLWKCEGIGEFHFDGLSIALLTVLKSSRPK